MKRSIPTLYFTIVRKLTTWRLILIANVHLLEFAIWLADRQQYMLHLADWPRSPAIDARKAELDGELLQYRMQLQCL